MDANSEKLAGGTIVLNQGDFRTQIQPSVRLVAGGVNPGACVIGIGKIGETYCAGHFQPGEIVVELQGIAQQSVRGLVSVHQSSVEDSIQSLYISGVKYNENGVKQAFKGRDGRYGY